ncbi:Sensor protein KdpD [Thiorhodovibrio winogradskyi]|uniref:histidine kinase n=1 Tax=Thiorhodovibrio winogradskyi TaxID=77007 RepID=A0ABZ0S5L4_9GAMM|nr:sensor histidine kinase [Thiorhodovibrio winogradskyi]
MRPLLTTLLVLTLTCLVAEARPQTQDLVDVPVIRLDQGQLAYLRDPSRAMTLDQARDALAQGRFQGLSANLGIGYVPDAVWLSFRLERQADQPSHWWLELMPTYLDSIALFHRTPTGQWDQRQAGDRLPQSAKEIDYRGTVFKLDLAPGPHAFFIRLQTTSTMAAMIKLWQPPAFKRHILNSYFGYGFYFSLIFAVLMFNSANWMVSRRPIFIAYSGYLALNLLKWLCIYGFASEFFFPQQPLLANLTLGIILAFDFAVAMVFFALLLELRHYHRYIYRLYQFGFLLAVATAIATPLGYYQWFAQWVHITAIAIIASTPWPAVRLWRTGELAKRLLAIALTSHGLLIGMTILTTLAILPFRQVFIDAGLASNLTHIMLLHFGMLLHYRRIEQEHAKTLEQAALDRKNMESEKRRWQEQNQLLDMITHEIRTPISVIDGARQTLQSLDEDEGRTTDNERVLRYITMEKAVHRLDMLLELVVAHHKIQPTEWRPMDTWIDPHRLSEEALAMLDTDAANRVKQITDLPPTELRADERRMRFALLNLLDNACKYSPAESPVMLRLDRFEHQGEPGLRWRIENQGTGVPDGMAEPIFEKYVRLGETNGQPGLGLGLYLVRQIVERHGGWVRADTGLNRGACFIVWLPIQRTASAPK